MASKKSTQASYSPCSKHPNHHHRYSSMSTTSYSDDSPVYSCGDSPVSHVVSSSSPPPLRYFGIPFSWEQFPGIPKKPSSKSDPNSLRNPLLPLPPSGYNYYRKERVVPSSSLKKHNRQHSHDDTLRKDPFFAALIECSKDDFDGHEGSAAGKPNQSSFDHHNNNNKVTRSISDRFGFVGVYTSSCKRTCAVSESIVCVSSRTTRSLGHRY